MKIKIDVDTWERQTVYAKEQFGDWASEGGINSVSAYRAKDDQHYAVYDLDVQVGGYVFAVVAEYGTGDTFGHQSGGQVQIIGAWDNVERADQVKELCELYTSDRGAYDDKFEALVLQGLEKRSAGDRLDQGLVIDGESVYPYWTGYFDRLNEIKVWLCRVEP